VLYTFFAVLVPQVSEKGDHSIAGFPIDCHQAKSSADWPKDNLVKCTNVAAAASFKSFDSFAFFYKSLSQSIIRPPAISTEIIK